MDTPDLSRLKIDRTKTAFARSGAGGGWKRRLVPALLVVAALAGAAIVYFRVAAAPVEVETAAVTMAYPSQSFTVLNATGYVVAQRKAAVASKATGRLVWRSEERRVRKECELKCRSRWSPYH